MQYHNKIFKEWTIKFLRRLEPITGTDNVYLAKNNFYLWVMQGINVLNGFVLYILIAHFLPKEIYGQYKYLLSLYGLFSIATLTGVDTALARAAALDKDGSLKAAFRLKLLGGVVGSLIAVGLALYYSFQGRPDLMWPLLAIAVFSPVIYASMVGYSFLSGKKRFDLFCKASIATTLIYFLGMAMAFVFLRSPVQIILVYLVSNSAVFGVYLYARSLTKNREIDTGMRDLAIHISALDVLGIIANQIDGVLIFHFLDASSLAIYSLATIPVEQMKGFLKSVQSSAFPKFATADITGIKKTLNRKIAIFMLGITFLMLIYIILAKPFFSLFFPHYLSSVPYSQVYSLSIVFGIPASLILTLFQAKALKQEYTVFNIANYSIQILMLVVGCWLYGLWGAIFARVISRLLMLVSTQLLFKHVKASKIPV